MNQAKVPEVDLGLEGKHVVVLGVADETSIAWGIAEAFLDAGSLVRIGFQQKFFSRVRPLFLKYPQLEGRRCDVLNDAELREFFESMGDQSIDVLVHSIAYGAMEIFLKQPSAVSLEAMSQALTISAYSLPLVVRYAKPRLAPWSSVMALTYGAAERAQPFYGMMGVAKSSLQGFVRYLAAELGSLNVRVNAISPAGVETLAALGIVMAYAENPEAVRQLLGTMVSEAMEAADKDNPGLRYSDQMAWAKLVWRNLSETHSRHCPLPELLCKEDVANYALFLGSDLSRKITGQVLYVDCGLSTSHIL